MNPITYNFPPFYHFAMTLNSTDHTKPHPVKRDLYRVDILRLIRITKRPVYEAGELTFRAHSSAILLAIALDSRR